jgi:hypothetical protein
MPVRGAIIAFIAAGLNGGSARKKARPTFAGRALFENSVLRRC